MFANDAAKIIGIKPQVLRKFLRNHNIDATRGKAARYEFTMEEVLALRDRFFPQEVKEAPYVDDSAPGLPIESLTDPAQRQAFRELRRARNARLQEQMYAARMTLPQMSNEVLVATGRIL